MIDKAFPSFAGHLADLARIEILQLYRTRLVIDDKADASPVTLADRNAEAMMRSAIEVAYPQHGIIGEEFGNVRENAEWVWVLDPVDGTKSFICGRATFVTLIGLLHRGVPVLGVIDQPVMAERWLGGVGLGTTLNGMLAFPSGECTLARARMGSTGPEYYNAEGLAKVHRLQAATRFTLWGGDGYLFGQLASGGLEIAIEQGLKLHDFAALAPVVQGAGGVMTDWQGRALGMASAGDVLACATPALHAAALANMQSAI